MGVYGFKAWFWSKISGIPLNAKSLVSKEESWNAVFKSAASLKKGQFWNEALTRATIRVPGPSKRPEWVWLQLLEKLRSNVDAAEFLELLGTEDRSVANPLLTPAARRMAPELVVMLRTCVLAHALDSKSFAEERPTLTGAGHPLRQDFVRWANRQMTATEAEEFKAQLARPDARISAFLANGWSGVAVILGDGVNFELPEDAPDWLDFGYARALQMSVGLEAAIDWLQSCTVRSTASDLFLGELLLGQGETTKGIIILKKVATSQTRYSDHAAWTLAITALEQGKSKIAIRWVEQSEGLKTSSRGSELLARAALLTGDRIKATAIYKGISDDSVDALAFPSKEAFA